LKKRRIVLVFLTTLSVITFLDRLAIAVAGPRIQSEFQLGPEQWGWVLAAFALSYGLFEIPSGAAGDHFGHRSTLTRIVLWWSVFTGATAAATGFRSLVATQFLFGAGEAGAYPNAAGVIGRWFPNSERARAQGFVWAASRIGGALSPLLVVPLLRTVGWRAMFCLFAMIGLAWALLWRSWFHNIPAEQPGITDTELSELDPPVSGTSPDNLWTALLLSRQAWLLVAMYWCYVWGSWFYFSWFPTYLMRGPGFTESQMSLVSALPFIFGCAGNLIGGWLSDQFAQHFGLRTARCGLASVSLSVSSLMILGLAFATSKTAVVVLASLGLGVLDLMLPAAWSLCLDLGRAHAGVISGAMNAGGLTGGFACTLVFGYLVRATGGYRASLCTIAAMVMVSALLFLCIDPAKPVWSEAV
jgi:ACS family glucarate transporter-like MFS transporter